MAKWCSYFWTINNSPASIATDAELIDSCPDAARMWLLIVSVLFLSPRPDGLSSTEEAPRLFEIEDSLSQTLGRSCNALFVGRITNCGKRIFYFYAAEASMLLEAVGEAEAQFPKYRFEQTSTLDKNWELYKMSLFPAGVKQQLAMNSETLGVLQENGDRLSIPREVNHWIYFKAAEERTAFGIEAVGAGFSIQEEWVDKGEWPYAIRLSNEQAVEPFAIDATVIRLFQLSQKYKGDYDGWETQVMSNSEDAGSKEQH